MLHVIRQVAAYSFPAGHPFNAVRSAKFFEQMADAKVTWVEPRDASEDDILLFHAKEYIDFVRRKSSEGSGYLDSGDTPAFPGVYEAAAGVVGGTLTAVDAVVSGKCRSAFNPIGGLHHARRGSAGGFCVFNDIGVAIEYLRKNHMRRLLYFDIDAHHGNGVYYDYEEDPDVIIVDAHEYGTLYPGTGSAAETGREAGKGTKLNLPLAAGSGDREFFAAFEKAKEFIRQFDGIEFVIFQCGADSLAGDPLTNLYSSPAVHRAVAGFLRDYAEKNCRGMVALGGGGYNPLNVAVAWSAVAEEMGK